METLRDPATKAVRIANCSGFYGDRLVAAKEMVLDGPIDVLTGDYLAELTMLLLATRQERGGPGYVPTILPQLEDVLGVCIERGIRVVTNAGGLDPALLANALKDLASRLSISCRVAHIEGDNILDRIHDLRAEGIDLENLDSKIAFDQVPSPIRTANAYLGGWGIVGLLREAVGAIGSEAWCRRQRHEHPLR